MDEKLLFLLKKYPVASAKQLTFELAISQQALSKKIRQAGSQIVRIGKARASRYALAHQNAQFPKKIPLFSIDQQGHAECIAFIYPLDCQAFLVEPLIDAFWLHNESGEQLFHDLPYFLETMRPEGFLGRIIAKKQILGLPNDARNWNAWNMLNFIYNEGFDCGGNLVLGETALAKAGEIASIKAIERNPVYPQLANVVLQGECPGSSAGGEQPKFTACIDGNLVIVKFSPKINHSAGRRWADLLIAEHIASSVLLEVKLPASQAEILITDHRVFLEIKRFDRVGKKGRKSFFPLSVIDAEYTGLGRGWKTISERLVEQKKLSDLDFQQIKVLDYFGELIANTDRHLGNLSFTTNNEIFSLAPIYDMLPMYYAPERGEIVLKQHKPPVSRKNDPEWDFATKLALLFWQRVSQDGRISSDFQAIAKNHHQEIVEFT